jgi:hypothetical protein
MIYLFGFLGCYTFLRNNKIEQHTKHAMKNNYDAHDMIKHFN